MSIASRTALFRRNRDTIEVEHRKASAAAGRTVKRRVRRIYSEYFPEIPGLLRVGDLRTSA
jgi:hypothetical protein